MKIRALIVFAISAFLTSNVPSQTAQSTQTPTQQKQQSGAESSRPKLKIPDDAPALQTQKPQKEDNESTIKLDTTLVNVPVLVMDREGKYIPNLTRDDFQIFEDNIKQEIDGFNSAEEPFNVALMLDTSGSTRFKIDDIQRAALSFSDKLREQDRMMVVSFDSKIYVDSEMTGNRRQMRQAILQTRTGGATRLYDAIDLTITERLNKIEGRKAIVLFTDGVDSGSRIASALSALELIEESNVLLYVVQYDTKNDVNLLGRAVGVSQGRIIMDRTLHAPRASEKEYQYGDRFLQQASEVSGARLYQAENITGVNQAFDQIAEELRRQYSLTYYPSNEKRDGSYRKIHVVVSRPDSAVRARKGYRAISEAPAQEIKQ
ncbi:MAG TPA: VWA domain-containing protein [Blastocatellia bacterium]|nr:VWA domain-containing protein [Blastocatellia bacterium]